MNTTYTVTVKRCCGHTETFERFANISTTQEAMERMESQLCLVCEEECRAWEAQNHAVRMTV